MPNASQPLRAEVKQILGICIEAFTERYLGLPTAVGRITSGTFNHIGERSRGKMQGWSERGMACAAREVLLKSIVQAIPTFSTDGAARLTDLFIGYHGKDSQFQKAKVVWASGTTISLT